MLLEREGALDAARAALDTVRETGRGRFVIVGGEAGVGKTSVLRHVADEVAAGTTVVWGACDSLSTPRPLGPLADIAAQTGGELADALASGAPREAVFAAAVRFLAGRAGDPPIVVMIEDAHWADEATVDFLTFLRRRIDATRALVVLSYRDDEIGPSHPLRFVLGDTSVRDEVRLRLEPLSVDAVAQLAAATDRAVDAAHVHGITGGNPFFVTEVLAVGAAGGDDPPPTVRDAVLARASHLSEPARAVLDAIAIVPARAELWLVDQLVDDPQDVRAVDDCVASGVLRPDGDGVTFRHELARLAVRDAVAPARRRELHTRALAALAAPPQGVVDEARLAHHAYEAGDADAVLAHAPVAAMQAARVGAHTQAADHLEHAVRYVGLLPLTEQIDLWFRLGIEQVILGRLDDAVASTTTAIELCRRTGDRAREGLLLSRLGTIHTSAGDQSEATRRIDEAFAVLEPLGPTPELAYHLAIRSGQRMLAREFAEAEVWGQRGDRALRGGR